MSKGVVVYLLIFCTFDGLTLWTMSKGVIVNLPFYRTFDGLTLWPPSKGTTWPSTYFRTFYGLSPSRISNGATWHSLFSQDIQEFLYNPNLGIINSQLPPGIICRIRWVSFKCFFYLFSSETINHGKGRYWLKNCGFAHLSACNIISPKKI